MNTVIIINFFTSLIVFIVGIVFLTGMFLPNLETDKRLIFGIIFVSYSIYRFINAFSKLKLYKQEKKHKDIKEAQEKLIKNQKIKI